MPHFVTDLWTKEAAVWSVRILLALGTLLLGWAFAHYLRRSLARYAARSTRVDPTLIPFVGRILHWLVIAVTVVAVLGKFGVDTSSVLAVLGAAGLAVGLALKDTLSDVASGIVLLVLRPFDAGDSVSIDGTQGEITAIDVFETRLISLEGVPLVLPNSKVRAAKIENFSRADIRRVLIVVGIGYAEDIGKALAALREIVELERRALLNPAPVINVNDLGPVTVNLLCQVHTKAEDFLDTKMDLNRAIKERFEREGMALPVPAREVHVLSR